MRRLNKVIVGYFFPVLFITVLFVVPANAQAAEWHIQDDATGGDCSIIGNWVIASKTCTLSQDLSQGIIIDSDDIILDGIGHTMTGSKTGNGVYLNGRTGITVENLEIKNFLYGIRLDESSNNILTGNTTSNSDLDGGLGTSIICGDACHGIFLYRSNGNTLTSNTTSNNITGIFLYSSNDNILKGNTSSNNLTYGILVYVAANNNQIYNNNLIDNTIQMSQLLSSGDGSVFSLAPPIGGNFWSDFDESSDGCNNINNDSFCDAPYIFSAGQDNLPWTVQNGWISGQQSATLRVIKQVINNNGGVAVPSDFSFQVSGSTTTQPIIQFNVNGQNDLTLPSGIYRVTESVANGYSTTYNGCSNIVLFSGGQATCIITNTDIPIVAECCSSVLFLPGIEGSRLYIPGGRGGARIWEPGPLSGSVLNLSLDESGFSERSDIVTRDVIDRAVDINFGPDIYASFISSMDTLKNTGTINDWEPIPYDWRLALGNILISGKKNGDDISYLQGTSTPYIIQELRRLASNSKTGKVTIVAHSNGGLVTKLLTKILGQEAPTLIDKIIFVAAPQVGTPEGVAGLLHGHGQAIPYLFSAEDARALGQNMPVAYNLLPSEKYFLSVTTPVVTFDTSLPDWIALYGSIINSFNGLQNFLTDTYGRVSPFDSNTTTPATINKGLLSNANDIHENILDNWHPPTGVKFITIAGWGDETLSQIAYKMVPTTICENGRRGFRTCRSGPDEFTFDPKFVVDGDGTVVEPSALWKGEASNTRYWVNLSLYNGDHPNEIIPYEHARMFATTPVKLLLNEIINGAAISLTQYVTNFEPATSSIKRLHFTLHSPLTLGFIDSEGNYSGATSTGVLFNVPGVNYERYGDVQWLSLPKGLAGQLVMHGTGSGSFTLDIDETSGNTEISSTSFKAIPSSTSTVATIDISPIFSPTASSTLIVDFDGDGESDFIVTPNDSFDIDVNFQIIKRFVTALDVKERWKNEILVELTVAEKLTKKETSRAAKTVLNNLLRHIDILESKGELRLEIADALAKMIQNIQFFF